jgi:lactoylglutathione lyase
MIRTADLERSITFYTQILGMKLLRRKDYPEGRFTLAFVGYGDEAEHAAIELTHNWDTQSYDLGTGFGHLAIEVEDAGAYCAQVSAMVGKWFERRGR